MAHLRLLFAMLALLLAVPADQVAGADDDGDTIAQWDDHGDQPHAGGLGPVDLPTLPTAWPSSCVPSFADLRLTSRAITVHLYHHAVPATTPRTHRVQHRSGGDSGDEEGASPIG